MGRYLGPRCRLSRREGTDLELTSGLKPIESKCKFKHTPGQHWANRGRLTEYATQLRMKQLVKRYYGILERQMVNYYKKASRMAGSTGDNLLRLLESRLDNVVYRMGFAATRAEARQLVSHKSIMVNSSVVNIPSYLVSPGSEIEIVERVKAQTRILAAVAIAQNKNSHSWISVDCKNLKGTYVSGADVDEISSLFKVSLILELYSK